VFFFAILPCGEVQIYEVVIYFRIGKSSLGFFFSSSDPCENPRDPDCVLSNRGEKLKGKKNGGNGENSRLNSQVPEAVQGIFNEG